MQTIKQILDRTISILLPKRCVLCGEVVAYDDLWCGKCDIAYTDGIMLPEGSNLDGATSPAYYAGNARSAVLRLKREPDERIAHFFAELMSERVKAELGTDFDMLIPIPLSHEKRSERGFNQAEMLAHELGEIMGKNVECDILSQNSFAEAQHELTARDRIENAKKSYSIISADKVDGKNILLVDDVYTTGATVGACALLLKKAGAAGVSAVTATYTRGDTDRRSK